MVNLKELVFFVLKTCEVIGGIADGVDLGDLAKLIAAGKAASPAFKDAALALAEYANMSDAQALELEQYCVDNFDLTQDNVEFAIESGLRVAIQLHDLAKLLLPKP